MTTAKTCVDAWRMSPLVRTRLARLPTSMLPSWSVTQCQGVDDLGLALRLDHDRLLPAGIRHQGVQARVGRCPRRCLAAFVIGDRLGEQFLQSANLLVPLPLGEAAAEEERLRRIAA